MAVQLILKNSSVEDKRPTAAQLANGEISLNYSEAGAFLCCRDDDGNIQQVGGIKINEDAPGSPVLGTLWLRASTSTLFIYDGNTWLAISGGSGGGGGTGGAIDQLVAGDGIDITPTSGVGVVTVDNDIDKDRGLEFVSGRTAVKIGKGLEFDGATGSINATATALAFKGTIDLTTPGDVPADPELGDSYVNVGEGVFDGEWTAATGEDPTTEASPGDLVVWNGTVWVYIPIGTAPSGADLDYAPTTGTSPGTGGTVLSTFGTDAVIPMAGYAQSGVLAGAAQAGLMKPEDRTLLDSLPVDGGEFEQVQSDWDETDITDPSYIQNKPDITFDGNDDITNVNVDLGYTPAADKGTVTNNRGTDATIPVASVGDASANPVEPPIAGLFTGEEKEKLAGIEAGATADGYWTEDSGKLYPTTLTNNVGIGTDNPQVELDINGKARSTSTESTDVGTTLVTKDYLEDYAGSSSVSVGETPPVDPEVGDLWWNTDDGRLYVFYQDGDSSQWVDASPDSQTEVISNGPSFPTDAEVNDLFFNTTEGRLYIYFDDGSSQQWVDAAPQGSAGGGDGGGDGSGVSQIVAGTNVTISPVDGKGIVTINASGDGGPTTPGVRYQEGTWTPVFSSGSMNSPQATWTRSGNTIFVTVDQNWATVPTGIDEFGIEGLPYTSNVFASGSLYVQNKDTELVAIPFTTKNANKIGVKGVSTKAALTGTVNLSNGFFKDGYLNITLVYTTDDTTFVPGTGSTVTEDIQGTGGGSGGGDATGVGADAWGNVAAGGTLESSFNVASVSRFAQGTYDVVFTVPMPNNTYSLVGSAENYGFVINPGMQESTGFSCRVQDSNGADQDGPFSFVVHASSTVTPTYTWTRNGTTLEPANAGDDVDLGTGDLTATAGTFSGGSVTIRNDNAGFQYNRDSASVFFVKNDATTRPCGVDIRIPNGATSNAADDQFYIRGGKVSDYLQQDFVINTDGSASFGGGNISLNADGQSTFTNKVVFGTDLIGTQSAITVGDSLTDSNRTLDIRRNGTVNSTTNVIAGGQGQFGLTQTGTQPCIVVQNDEAGAGRVFEVDKAGNISGNNVRFFLDGDNPSNFSVEGEYTGPTLDVKDRILNLISRLDAIEANEIIDDATDTSLLQLLANASSRLDSIEARLAALEGVA